jgi:hypothetical protein
MSFLLFHFVYGICYVKNVAKKFDFYDDIIHFMPIQYNASDSTKKNELIFILIFNVFTL